MESLGHNELIQCVMMGFCGIFLPNSLCLVLFIDMEEGTVGDMSVLGITESLRVKRQMLMSAAEAAEMILRVDDIIKARPRQRQPDECH